MIDWPKLDVGTNAGGDLPNKPEPWEGMGECAAETVGEASFEFPKTSPSNGPAAGFGPGPACGCATEVNESKPNRSSAADLGGGGG
jgi:hypothetical protein